MLYEIDPYHRLRDGVSYPGVMVATGRNERVCLRGCRRNSPLGCRPRPLDRGQFCCVSRRTAGISVRPRNRRRLTWQIHTLSCCGRLGCRAAEHHRNAERSCKAQRLFADPPGFIPAPVSRVGRARARSSGSTETEFERLVRQCSNSRLQRGQCALPAESPSGS